MVHLEATESILEGMVTETEAFQRHPNRGRKIGHHGHHISR